MVQCENKYAGNGFTFNVLGFGLHKNKSESVTTACKEPRSYIQNHNTTNKQSI